ncbi:MAG TPA: hypothetical protein VG367_09940 [Mucilaginibacter sp.]|jgi:hypothetical protein|nr:hypothetical protein [Mucilaginibacter sp.]
MKNVLLLMIGICAAIGVRASNKPDTSLSAYIASKSYISLADRTKLPESVRKNYGVIMNYLGKMDIEKAWYTSRKGIHESATSISIECLNIDGIKLQKQLTEREKSIDTVLNGQRLILQFVDNTGGNPSGKDGVLILDKQTRQVTYKLSE